MPRCSPPGRSRPPAVRRRPADPPGARGSVRRSPARPRSSPSCGTAVRRATTAATSTPTAPGRTRGERTGRRQARASAEDTADTSSRDRTRSPHGTGTGTGGTIPGTKEVPVQVGLLIPQGWKGEYDGWHPADAWARTVDLAKHAEALGFESEWVFDHFTTVPDPTDEITFESFSTLSALAMVTQRVRIGHMVICTGFRNPALTAKLASTIDVISGGRFELGIGAGWTDD